MITTQQQWIRQEHILQKQLRNLPNELKFEISIPKWQWKKNGHSIISPSDVSFGSYEVMKKNSMDVCRFETLQEAKDFCEKS